MSEPTFSHLDDAGNARMVNVGDKDISQRRAVAQCSVLMSAATAAAIRDGAMKKGDVLGVARVAGIQAAKKTSDLIPLCHPIMISGVTVDFVVTNSSVDITATVTTVDRTGVEMEALTACSVAALTVYDMCKAVDKGMVIGDIRLLKKTKSEALHR